MTLDDELDRVEKYGFRRDIFPLSLNGHKIWLVDNQAHVTEEERLYVHFILYCQFCGMESTLRGRCKPQTNWTPEHLQDVEIAVLGKFIREDCN